MPKADNLYKLIIAQSICVLLIILSVAVTKYFFKGTYKKFVKWYDENVTVTTDVNEVLSNEI